MTTYRIHNERSGADLGVYEGETPEHAIAAMYRDAGYQAEVADGEVVVGDGAPDYLIADPIGALVAVEVEPESGIELAIVEHAP